MRILMASDFYPPFIGGAERQVQLLSKELVRRGHTLSVATVWHAGLPSQQDDAQVTIHRIKGLTTRVPWFSKDPKHRYHPPFPDPGIVLGLRRLITRFRPDVVHAHGWIAYSCAAALLGKKIPLVVSVRDYGYSCAIRTLLRHGEVCSGPAPAKCMECALHVYSPPKAVAAVSGIFAGRALLMRKIGAIHSVSTFVQKIVNRDLLGGRKRKVTLDVDRIPDIVIPSFLERIQHTVTDERYLDQLPNEPYILFVGSLQAHKGLGPLLAAYEQLEAPPPLVLIGTKWPDTPEFPAHITVLHNVPHHVVMAAWKRCMFGVAPSIWPDPLPGTVREAMSQGKAIIATDIGGNPDMIEPGLTGILVPPDDVAALRAAMSDLIADPALRDRLGAAGRERAESFTAAAVLPRFEELYQHFAVQPPATVQVEHA